MLDLVGIMCLNDISLPFLLIFVGVGRLSRAPMTVEVEGFWPGNLLNIEKLEGEEN